ncbi:hypothetical protein [Priestia megaterium]|uniref:hypothetical protein n=1 Tax=Priestia megaterium TaxID=1404 RepID=UPI0022B8C4E4|nr:hypothetical protein [Priestia megaterium]MCZ8493596.1 hypothetical protein [Priestia megaterium]
MEARNLKLIQEAVEAGDAHKVISLIEELSKDEIEDIINTSEKIRYFMKIEVMPAMMKSRGPKYVRISELTEVLKKSLEEFEQEEQEEQQELNARYAKRAETPLNKYIKYKGPDHLYELVIERMKQMKLESKDE